MDIDDVYKEIGEFGSYQKKIFWTFSFCQAALTLHQVHNVFVGAMPVFFCKRGTGQDALTVMGCPVDDQPCDSYVFAGEDFTSTVSEFNLVCQDAYKSDLAQSCVMLGILFGSLLFGYLADKYGRRKIVYMSPIGITAVTVLGIFSPNYNFYLLMRLLAGMFCGGLGMIGFVLITEVLGQSKRAFAGMVLPMCFAVGLGIYALLAYYIRDWKLLSIVTSLPMLVGIPMYWLYPESPRWLFSQGRVDEAERLLEMIAYRNNGHLPNKTILLKRDNEDAPIVQTSLLDVVKHPILRSMTLNNAFTWFVNCAVYYGLTLGVGNLGVNLYMSVALSGLVEIPAYLLAYFLMERIGRRWTYSISMLAGGLFCLAIVVVPTYSYRTRMILAICGKMCISMSFCVAWLYGAEMYPTNIRNKALSVCNMMARLGGIVCPMIIAYGKTHQNMDFLMLGLMTFLAGIVCLKLPETLGRPMPETVEDLENSPSQARSRKPKTNSVDPPNISEEKLKLLQDEIENNEQV